MLPSRNDWSSWTLLERISYLAQFAAVLSLLPTVIFAWLGWREARLARTEQMQFFIAEKAPDIELSAIRILPIHASEEGIVTCYLKNKGSSSARNIRVLLFRNDTLKKIADSGGGDTLGAHLWIDRDKEFPFPCIGTKALRSQIGYVPTALRVARPGESLAANEQIALVLSIGFEGPFRDEHGVIENVVATRNK